MLQFVQHVSGNFYRAFFKMNHFLIPYHCKIHFWEKYLYAIPVLVKIRTTFPFAHSAAPSPEALSPYRSSNDCCGPLSSLQFESIKLPEHR